MSTDNGRPAVSNLMQLRVLRWTAERRLRAAIQSNEGNESSFRKQGIAYCLLVEAQHAEEAARLAVTEENSSDKANGLAVTPIPPDFWKLYESDGGSK